MQNNPLNKVVFIQKVATFTKTKSIKDLFQLAYVNNSWNDTIKNYSFHIFEKRARAIASANELEYFCANVIKCDVTWFLKVLLFSKSVLDRVNALMLVCQHAPSSSQMDVMQLVFKKIVEVGGTGLLTNQLTATDQGGSTCLMHGCANFSSPEVMKLMFEKINESGGPVLVKSQLVATNSYGENCLMFCSNASSSPEVVKVVFEKIVEAGSIALLKKQLLATDNYGRTCLMFGCRYSSSPEVMKLFAAVFVELDVFKQQYSKLDDGDKEDLRDLTEKVDEIKAASWVPDPDTVAEVKKLLKC